MGKQKRSNIVRLVSWKMAFWTHGKKHEEAWRWPLEELKPDIALCQECIPPDWARLSRTVVWERAYPTGEQRWGTALVTSLPAKPTRLPELDSWLARVPEQVEGQPGLAPIHRADGWVAIAEINIPIIGSTLVTSIHNPFTPIEATRLTGIVMYPR